jgi:hypothetical protein
MGPLCPLDQHHGYRFAHTVRYAHRALSLILDHAVRDGRLARNAAHGVRLPRVVQAERVFLDHEQVAALAAAAGPYGRW